MRLIYALIVDEKIAFCLQNIFKSAFVSGRNLLILPLSSREKTTKNNFVDGDISETSLETVSVLFSKLKSFVNSLLPI